MQKYEQGQTRISSGVLFQLAQLLEVPPHYFFEGIDTAHPQAQGMAHGIDVSDVIAPDRHPRLNLLVVEDDPADQLLLRRAIAESPHTVEIHALQDGECALEFLRESGDASLSRTPFSRPDLILLDLHLPGRDGMGCLREIKRDRALQDIPVVIITHELQTAEMVSAYKQYAAGYIYKSFDFARFRAQILSMINYWANATLLPGRARG